MHLLLDLSDPNAVYQPTATEQLELDIGRLSVRTDTNNAELSTRCFDLVKMCQGRTYDQDFMTDFAKQINVYDFH